MIKNGNTSPLVHRSESQRNEDYRRHVLNWDMFRNRVSGKRRVRVRGFW